MRSKSKLERSARFWMRAYPRRWRVTFGDDLVAVLHDVTEPGAQRVPIREAVEIMRAGWARRWREHPPFWRWAGYRFLGMRLPDQYRFWTMDDILGGLYVLRANWLVLVLIGGSAPFNFQTFLANDRIYIDWIIAVAIPLTAVLAMAVFQGQVRRNAWRHSLASPPPPKLLSWRTRRKLRLESSG